MTADQPREPARPRRPDLQLMYFGYATVSVRGPVSGQLYHFSRQQPVQAVDARDAVSILKTRMFRRMK